MTETTKHTKRHERSGPPARVLSTRQLAQAVGVSPSTVKRWTDEGRVETFRTPGGHRRIPLRAAARLLRETGLQVVRPELLGVPALGGLAGGVTLEEAMWSALFEGKQETVRGLLLASYLAGSSVSSLCDGPITRALERIGDLWRHDESGILVEHRAVDICVEAILEMRLLLPAYGHDAPVAVGAALEEDPYLLPTLMAATVLSEEGWRAVNLGPHTPLGTLELAMSQTGAGLVWLSVSTPPPPKLIQAVERLAKRALARGAQVVLGGRRCKGVVARRVEGLIELATLSELAAFSRGLARSERVRGSRTPRNGVGRRAAGGLQPRNQRRST